MTMRLRILLGLLSLALVFAATFGFFTLRNRARQKAEIARKLRFAIPYNSAITAFQQNRYADAEAILTGLLPELERDSPDSVSMASVLHGLASLAHIQGRNVEA
jgi:hypothetical protein